MLTALSEVLEQTEVNENDRRTAAMTVYKELVRRLADDESTPVEHVERALARAGKTPADLKNDVYAITRRRGLEKVAGEREQRLQEMRNLHTIGKAIAEQFEKAQRDWQIKLAEHQQKERNARSHFEEAEKARKELAQLPRE